MKDSGISGGVLPALRESRTWPALDGDDRPTPLLVLGGCHRSANTLLKRMIDAHPQIRMTGKSGYRKYIQRKNLTPDGMLTPAFVSNLLELGKYTPDELEELPRPVESVSFADYMSWCLARETRRMGKSLVGLARPSNIRKLGVMHELWPRTRFVHLIRDGRDVCLSASGWGKGGLPDFETWEEDPISTVACWWKWHVLMGREAGFGLGHDLYHEVRYEELIADPESECRKLCEFLDVPYDDAMIRFHEGRVRTEPGLDAKHAWLPPTRGLRNWREQMPVSDLERFEAAAGELLDELGYERGARQLSPSAREQAARIGERFVASRVHSPFAGDPIPQGW